MFKSEDFELSLENQLTQRMIDDDIKKCQSVEVLRESLIATHHALMTQQQLIKSLLRKQLSIEVSNLLK